MGKIKNYKGGIALLSLQMAAYGVGTSYNNAIVPTFKTLDGTALSKVIYSSTGTGNAQSATANHISPYANLKAYATNDAFDVEDYEAADITNLSCISLNQLIKAETGYKRTLTVTVTNSSLNDDITFTNLKLTKTIQTETVSKYETLCFAYLFDNEVTVPKNSSVTIVITFDTSAKKGDQ